jgi:hypothetical protein
VAGELRGQVRHFDPVPLLRLYGYDTVTRPAVICKRRSGMIMQTILFRDAHPRRSRRNLTESTQQIEALGSGTHGAEQDRQQLHVLTLVGGR